MKRFDLKNINEVNIKEEYQIKISNRFVTLEHLDQSVYIDRASEVS
jgi:hypothetical protein